MKLIIRICLLILPGLGFAQEDKFFTFPKHLQNTCIAKLKAGDSLTYYQCYVTEAVQELTAPDGSKITGKPQRYTVTEKFKVYNLTGSYKMKYYTSSLTDYPNKKFAYLKLKEKDYWAFKLVKDTLIGEHDVVMFGAMEDKTHDTTEYDFKVTSATPNELIIMGRKVMKQLVVTGNYILRKNLDVLK